ncbi:hypothetical protein CONLIGDRAFT_644243 [Coniochaeta ligniaria NRRL 30616]|uniref:Mid2 domain-containing protein n=1 Tax=Coniochaeta ligniaria NRRL 30616 TaxID=1408157 RepID=A0A1J7JAA7_9PEZI|nr:hypothetical protein CONLIGDRAFT_644243 [Coniochaeta ligniaria NRRL 30616]
MATDFTITTTLDAYLTLMLLIGLTFNCVQAQTVVVTVTQPDPPPAVSSVVTTRQTILTEPIVSTSILVLTGDQGLVSTRTVIVTDTGAGSNNDDNNGSAGNQGGSGKGDLSKLEILGIVLGIVLGIITTIATVWMCLRGKREGS